MPRPTPNSQYLTRLATMLQKMHGAAIEEPTLLHATPGRRLAVMGSRRKKNLFVFEQETGDIIVELPMPERVRSAMDYRAFVFSEDEKLIGAYNRSIRHFTVWSFEQKKPVNHIKGEGRANPTIAFLPFGFFAISDGPRINMHRVGGAQDGYIQLADELQAIHFIPSPHDPGLLTAVASFQLGNDGHSICCFHIRNNNVVASGDGPPRRSQDHHPMQRITSLHEMKKIPGSTSKVMVVLEEERSTDLLEDGSLDVADNFQTRLLALDPVKCKFYRDDIRLEGRFCLESSGEELHLLDEWGRRRRVGGFPLKLETIDWRLE